MKRNLTKESVLAILKDNSTRYISGEEIAERLFITRSAVWKSIKTLREDGMQIEAISNKGYRLVDEIDGISSIGIKAKLSEECKDIAIKCYETVESTNDIANEWGRLGIQEECVVVAQEQTKGRGRRGREFYSPKDTGLYMSLCLFPETDAKSATLLTCVTAVAVCRALVETTSINPEIKWVNDIFYNDRKIAGILTEAVTSIEDGSLSYMVIGIGINLYDPIKGFPDAIKKIAGSVYSKGGIKDNMRNELAASIVSNFMRIYREDWSQIIDEYRKKSFLIGKTVIVHPAGRIDINKDNMYAKAIAIDDECHLVVEYENGKVEALSTGEVSVVKY